MSSSDLPLEQLLAATRRGDDQAAEQLFTRVRPWLLLLAQTQLGRRLSAKCDASDLVQRALLEAVRDLPHFRGSTEREFMAWLRQVLAHAIAHEARHYGATAARDLGREVSLEAELADSSVRLGSMLAHSDPSPSAQAAQAEQEVQLAAVLARLPDDYREVIVLRNLEGLAHEEVAQRLGRSSGAVRMLWVRALARLREELQRLGQSF